MVKLRLASFTTITRSRTLTEPTDVARQIHATACALYEAAGLDPRTSLRLVGVRRDLTGIPRRRPNPAHPRRPSVPLV